MTEPTDSADIMNARIRLRRTTSPADLTARLFGAPDSSNSEQSDEDATGGDTA